MGCISVPQFEREEVVVVGFWVVVVEVAAVLHFQHCLGCCVVVFIFILRGVVFSLLVVLACRACLEGKVPHSSGRSGSGVAGWL